jgi:transcriptional regulator with XRE-family HTH domain
MTKGERIKKLREEKCLTQEELARLLNTTKQTISKYEKGIVTNIPSDKLEEMMKIFDVTPNYLMDWKNKVEEKPVEMAERHFEMINDEDFCEIFEEFKTLDATKKKLVKDLVHSLSKTEA